MEKLFIKSNQLLKDSFKLALNVYESGFRPNYIVGVWRGGAPIGIAVQELLDIIKRERRLELCFEGDRLYTLKQHGVFYEQDLEIRNALWSCDGFLTDF